MPSLSSFCAVLKPLAAALHDEGGDAAGACRRIGLGIDHENVGVRAVRDPHLAPVEHVAVAARLRPQLHRYHVRAGLRLRHRERADVLAADQLRQVALALRVGAVEAQLIDAEVGVRAVGEPDGAGGARDLLHGNGVGEIAEAGPAKALRHGDAEEPELTERRPEVARKLIAAVDLRGARGDALRREAPHLPPDLIDAFAEAEIAVYRCVRGHELVIRRGVIV